MKLTFRPWHLLIHESFTTGEVSFEHNTQEPCNALPFLANLEESGTGIRHEVGLAAFGINGYADFGYCYLVTLGKGYGTGVDDRSALQYNGSSLALPSTTAQHQHT
ncbi:hypothetical protein [[Hallella] seregens]|uniref:Uncharacterized protein n=1 Tax=Hallella seregens ATCC 51272 TaxID=1336250 RepID=A0ABV5ZGH1_9BACT|nr:hypothetical protein [Hallella seregens]